MQKKDLISISFSLLIFGIMMIVIFTINQPNNDKAESVLENEYESPKTSSIIIESSKKKPKKTTIPKTKLLDVPIINQMDAPRLYNGCEVTSLAMILNFYGITITKNELASNLKRVPLTYENGMRGNPHDGFVGDVTGSKPGLSVYHEPIVDLAAKYVDRSKIKDITGSGFNQVIKAVGEDKPVWVITTSTFAPVTNMETWTTPTGKVKISFSVHSVVITGYDDKYIYLNNPYGQKNQQVDKETFIQSWEQMGKQAVYFTL